MDEAKVPYNPAHERLVVEGKLDQAMTVRWVECPDRVRQEVSPLARFIVTPELQQAITAAPEEQLELVDASPEVTNTEIAEYKLEALQLAEANVQSEVGKDNQHAYHNAEHTRQVIDRVEQLIKASQIKPTRDGARALFIAAAYHDAEHPGVARRPHPQDFSVEQHSAGLADAYAREHGFSLRQRVETNTAIIGTSFWDGKIQPVTELEQALQLADLGGYMEGLPDWLEQSLGVAAENATLVPSPKFVEAWLHEPDFDKAVQQWLVGQEAFIKYILRPAHDRYQQHYIQRTEPGAEVWSAELALQEKEAFIKGLLMDINRADQADSAEQIRQALRGLRASYAKTPVS